MVRDGEHKCSDKAIIAVDEKTDGPAFTHAPLSPVYEEASVSISSIPGFIVMFFFYIRI